jgi:hypothetical protein
VNLKTAKALGLAVPPSIMLRAMMLHQSEPLQFVRLRRIDHIEMRLTLEDSTDSFFLLNPRLGSDL